MSTHRDPHGANTGRRSHRTSHLASPRAAESRSHRRYKSRRKKLRAHFREKRRGEQYRSLMRLLASVQRFESFKLTHKLAPDALPLSCSASPIMPAIYPAVRNAKDWKELSYLLYRELRHHFPSLTGYCKWYGESLLELETSYRATDILGARRGNEYLIPDDRDIDLFVEQLERMVADLPSA